MAPDFVLQRVLATEERSRNYVRGHASLENRSNKLLKRAFCKIR